MYIQKILFTSLYIGTVFFYFRAEAENELEHQSQKNQPQSSAPTLTKPNHGDGRSIELNEQGVKKLKGGERKQAEELFKKALMIDSGNITAAYNLASLYLEDKKPSAAVKLLLQYLKVAPNDLSLNVRMGDALFVLKDVQESIKYYETAYKIYPAYPQLASKLATIYSLNNDLKTAKDYLLKAVELEPKNGQLLSNLSAVFLANKLPQDAISTAKRALQTQPNSEVYITLGSAYEMLNDKKNALIAYERAVDLGDNRKDLKEKIEMLKK
jgi:tetratricopeptide (TPR) repeat protein